MSEIQFIKNLSGNSGCNLNLYQGYNGEFFVRKDAGRSSYNKRLKKQFLKQKLFNLNNVKTPYIINYGEENNIFFFDMEFVNGITLSEYMEQIQVKEIVSLMELLFRSLPIATSKFSVNAQNVFQHKIASLKNSCKNANQVISKAITILENYDFSEVPQSYCCGDLTLENIILSNKGIYIIDLLDSFYNSWMIDVAKLLQDIDLGWSYRYKERSYNLNLRLEIAKQILIENLLNQPNGKNNLRTIYHILLLNILRIYPYIKDNTTADFINKSTLKLLDAINIRS